MSRRKMATHICASLLAVSLIAADTLPAFAAAVPESANWRQAIEANAAKDEIASAKDIRAQYIAQQGETEAGFKKEMNQEPKEAKKTEAEAEPTEEAEAKNGEKAEAKTELAEEAEAKNGEKAEAKTEPTEEAEAKKAEKAQTKTEPADEAGTELPKGEQSDLQAAEDTKTEETQESGQSDLETLEDAGKESPISEEAKAGKKQNTPAGIQESSDGLIYLDGVLFNGYYLDGAGFLRIVTNGAAQLKTGMVEAGTEYYSGQSAEKMKIVKQTLYVEGKAYTGYYLDQNGILYASNNGTAEPKTGMVEAGTEYYSGQSAEKAKIAKQTLYVQGKTYTGYYLDQTGILFASNNGAAEPKTGMVEAGTEYYSGQSAEKVKIAKQTLYVEGKAYTGYYMDHGNKMYEVKKGTAALKTGTVKAKTKYYGYDAKKMLTQSKKTLYVNGGVYSGYYTDGKNKLYYVKKGAAVLKTGTVKAKTKYYSSRAKKMRRLSKKTLYVKGNVYSGYYTDNKNRMYTVKKGTADLKTGTVKAKTKYYNARTKKTRRISKKTLYVKGNVYSGYYTDHKNKMYRVKKGTAALITETLKAKTKYYSYRAKKTLTLSKETLYIEGNMYTGYYLDQENKMYRAEKGSCNLVNATLNAGTRYYSRQAKKMLTLSKQTVYINGKAMEGMSAEALATFQRAQAIVARVTNDSMTKEQKLKACFDYVKTYAESRSRVPHYKGMDWPVIYANDIFVNGTGNCFSFAAAFAYMAKAIGYEEVYCCHSGGHGWAEIDGLVYDPEWSMNHHGYSYYALSYDTKTDQDYKGAIGARLPWMRIKI